MPSVTKQQCQLIDVKPERIDCALHSCNIVAKYALKYLTDDEIRVTQLRLWTVETTSISRDSGLCDKYYKTFVKGLKGAQQRRCSNPLRLHNKNRKGEREITVETAEILLNKVKLFPGSLLCSM